MIRFGVIGTNWITDELIASAAAADGFVPTAVCSRTEERAAEFAAKHQIPHTFTDVEKMAASGVIDAVYIASPNALHAEQAISCMKHGLHVLCEKPMAKTLEEAQKMIDTARATGKILMVGQSRRFFDAVRMSREMLDNIGRPFSVLYHWGSSFNESSAPPWWRSSEATGGLILPMSGSHAVDQILWYYGRKPKTVYAKIYNSKTYWEGASEASIIMEYGENEIATLKLSLATRPVLHQVVINGPKGTLVINHQEEKNVVGVGYLELMHDGEIVHKGLQRPTNFYYQAREFGSAILENRQPIASGFEVIENMKVLNAILASAESNLPVAVED